MYDFGPQITNAQHMISKHNHVRDAIFKAAVEAGLGPSREPDGLLPGSDDQPAEVLIPIWTEGRDTALNVTVVKSKPWW